VAALLDHVVQLGEVTVMRNHTIITDHHPLTKVMGNIHLRKHVVGCHGKEEGRLLFKRFLDLRGNPHDSFMGSGGRSRRW